jgi:hypothetical protein
MKPSGEFSLNRQRLHNLHSSITCSRKRRRFKRKSPEFYKKLFEEKLVKRCELVLESGKKKCEAAFDQVYQSCLKETPAVVNSVVCLPLKIDFICGAGNLFSKAFVNICDPSKVIDASFGTDYVDLKKVAKNFTNEYGSMSINYTTSNVKDLNAVKSFDATSRRVGRHLEEKANLIEKVFRYVQKLMILIYFKVIYGSFSAPRSSHHQISFFTNSIRRRNQISRRLFERN